MRVNVVFLIKALKVFLIVGAFVAGLTALEAMAADGPVFDSLLTKYQSAAQQWQGIMLSAAKSIFWPMALLSLSWRLLQRAIEGMDIHGLLREIFWPGFFIGFYYFLLINGADIASAILSTFMHLADRGSAISGMAQMAYSPSGIMSMANEIWSEVISTAGKGLIVSLIPGSDPGLFANLFGIFVSFGVWVLMAMIAIDVLILLIAAWVLLYGGLIILAFGGGFGFGFHQYAINYFRSVIALGLQLLGTGLIVTVGLSVMHVDVAALEYGFNMDSLMSLLLCAMAMKMVVSSIPPMLAGMINGNVGALGPKGEGVVGGLVASGVTMAATTASLGLGAVAAYKVKTAQAGLDQVKKAVNAHKTNATGTAVSNVNSISAGAAGAEEQRTSGTKFSDLAGHHFDPFSKPQQESSVSSPETPEGVSEAPSATPSADVGSAPADASIGAMPATAGVAGAGASGMSSVGVAGSGAGTGSVGTIGTPSASMDNSTLANGNARSTTFDTLNPNQTEKPLSGQGGQSFIDQLTKQQQELEDTIRRMSSKRDYHFASAKSSLISGSKMLFNYFAFFNNRGYF